MQDIICPKCKTAFKIDESGFADILKQVRNDEFKKELEERLDRAKKEKDSAVELIQSKLQNLQQEELGKKDKELNDLKSKIERSGLEKTLSVKEAVDVYEKRVNQLTFELQNKDKENKLNDIQLRNKHKSELELKAMLKNSVVFT